MHEGAAASRAKGAIPRLAAQLSPKSLGVWAQHVMVHFVRNYIVVDEIDITGPLIVERHLCYTYNTLREALESALRRAYRAALEAVREGVGEQRAS